MIIVSTTIFAYIWENKINVLLRIPFNGKGNVLIVVVYAIVVFLMLFAFQGLKLGYYTISNLLITRTIAYICAHVIIYVQILLMVGQVKFAAIIGGRVFEILLIVGVFNILLTILCTKVYNKLIPPYRMLMIYGDYKNTLKQKIDKRADKYLLQEFIYIGEDEEKIRKKILEYDAVVLNDIPTEKKNEILKFCFEEANLGDLL